MTDEYSKFSCVPKHTIWSHVFSFNIFLAYFWNVSEYFKIFVCVYLFNYSLMRILRHKFSFKQSLTGLRWEFSFLTSFHTKFKEPNMSY